MENSLFNVLNQDRGHISHKIFHDIYFVLLLICHLILLALVIRHIKPSEWSAASMKMKDQLDSPQPMKKPKDKAKKAEIKKKKQAKLKAKKEEKAKKTDKSKKASLKSTASKKRIAETKKDKKSKQLNAAPQEDSKVLHDLDAVKTAPVEAVNNDASSNTIEHTSVSVAPLATSKPESRRTVRRSRRKPSVEDIQALADNANRQRASKNLASLTEQEQNIATQDVVKRLLMGEISQGTALRELRVKVLGLRQEAYTELTGVSRKTLSEVENDKGNYTSEIINKMFKPFQLKVSLVPESSEDLKTILNQK